MPRLLVALCAALAVAAPASAAGRGHLLRGHLSVSPSIPFVGVRSTIRVELPRVRPGSRLSVRVVSPSGFPRKLRLAHVRGHVWRASFHFADDGPWTLTVSHGRTLLVDRVTVLQLPAPLPPFRTAANPAGGLGGLFR